MLFQIWHWLLCVHASNMAWVLSNSQIVFRFCTTDTLTQSMHNTWMGFCHANVIQTCQIHISLLVPLKTHMALVDLFQVHSGCDRCMTSLLKIMECRLIRRLPCVLEKSVLLITATRLQSRL